MSGNESGKPKFSWWIFIILLIVFWPLAIIYALISR